MIDHTRCSSGCPSTSTDVRRRTARPRTIEKEAEEDARFHEEHDEGRRGMSAKVTETNE
jgi:hypothetical protein